MSRSRVRYMYLSYQIRCIGWGKWKRRCHGCSDVRHNVQRTSLGGQIVETGTMCGLCGWNFEARPAQPPPLETGRHKRMQHNHPDHHSSVYSLTCTTTTTTTRPVRLPPPLPSERGTTSHHAIDDRSATSSSVNHSVQSRALHASSLVKQQQQHCPASITPPRNPREHVRSSDLHAMAVLHSQRPQSRSTSCRAAAADPGTIISLALRH